MFIMKDFLKNPKEYICARILKSIFFDRYRELFFLALPLVLSQGLQTILLLADRYILSMKAPMMTAVATTGGFTALSLNMFFIYFLSFSTNFVGENYGKNNTEGCERVLAQCFFFSTLFIPLIFLFAFFGENYFKWLGHPEAYRELEVSYFRIMMLSYIPVLFKTSLESYLIGMGRSKYLLFANIYGFFINVLFCYCFVVGPLADFFTAATGAAIATVLANIVALLVLMNSAPWRLNKESFFTGFRSFIVQGSYAGFEKFVNSFCFVMFVNMFVVYGPEISFAISIVFSWDQIAFLPLMGIYGAVMSLYSRYLGKGDQKEADKMVHSALQMTLFLMLIFSFIFLLFPEQLISAFLHTGVDNINFTDVQKVGRTLFKTTCFYIFIQSFIFIYKAALRSLGLSFWCFWCSLIIHLLLIISSYISIYILRVSPYQIWGYFMIMLSSLAIVFTTKFYQVRRNKRLIPAK